jgi:hypothetical protein
MKQGFRKTGQFLLPADKPPLLSGAYDIYPAFELPENQICIGFDQIANEISGHHVVCIDGYSGVLFDRFREELEADLIHKGLVSLWIDVSSLLKSESEINQLVEPFLGGDDPLFGTRTNLVLSDFFDQQKVKTLKQVAEQSLTIYYGTGAFLFAADGYKVYIDLPKNEVQFRSLALPSHNPAP